MSVNWNSSKALVFFFFKDSFADLVMRFQLLKSMLNFRSKSYLLAPWMLWHEIQILISIFFALKLKENSIYCEVCSRHQQNVTPFNFCTFFNILFLDTSNVRRIHMNLWTDGKADDTDPNLIFGDIFLYIV